MELIKRELTACNIWAVKDAASWEKAEMGGCLAYFTKLRGQKNAFREMLDIWFADIKEPSFLCLSATETHNKDSKSEDVFLSVDGNADCQYRNGILTFTVLDAFAPPTMAEAVEVEESKYEKRVCDLLGYLHKLQANMAVVSQGYGPGNSVIFAWFPSVTGQTYVVEIFIRGKKD